LTVPFRRRWLLRFGFPAEDTKRAKVWESGVGRGEGKRRVVVCGGEGRCGRED